MKGIVKHRATPTQSTNSNYQCTVEIRGLLQINSLCRDFNQPWLGGWVPTKIQTNNASQDLLRSWLKRGEPPSLQILLPCRSALHAGLPLYRDSPARNNVSVVSDPIVQRFGLMRLFRPPKKRCVAWQVFNYIYQHLPKGAVWTLRDGVQAPLIIHSAPLGRSRYIDVSEPVEGEPTHLIPTRVLVVSLVPTEGSEERSDWIGVSKIPSSLRIQTLP